MKNEKKESLREEFNEIGRRIFAASGRSEQKSISFYSTDSPAYRRSVSINIGIYLAKKGHSSVLINLDDSDDSFIESLGLNRDLKSGIFNLVNSSLEYAQLINKADNLELSFVPKGVTELGIDEVVNDNNVLQFLKYLENKYEFVLVNLPSNLDDIVLQTLGMVTDNFVYVVNSETKRKQINRVVHTLKNTKANVLGSIFIS